MYSFISNLVTSPLTYVLIVLVLALLIRQNFWKRILVAFSISLFFIFTNTPLLKFAEEKWYEPYDKPLDNSKVYNYGIVLGGYGVWDFQRNRPEFSIIGDRLFEGIRLYKKGVIKKIVLASDGTIIQQTDGKGLQGNPQGMLRYLNELGIRSEDIIMEKFASNTRENAIFTKKLLGADTLLTSSVLLITSAVHMRRSVTTFQEEGMYPDCYITDTWVETKGETISSWPSMATFNQWSEMLHEWIGYVVYKIRG